MTPRLLSKRPPIPFAYGLAAMLVALAGIVVGASVYEQTYKYELRELQHSVEQNLSSLNNDLRNEISKNYFTLFSLAKVLVHPDLSDNERQSLWQRITHAKVGASQRNDVALKEVYYISHKASKENGDMQCMFESSYLADDGLATSTNPYRSGLKKRVDLCAIQNAHTIFSRLKNTPTPLLIALEDLAFPPILEHIRLPNEPKEYALIYPFYDGDNVLSGWLIGALDLSTVEKILREKRVFGANVAVFDITPTGLTSLANSNEQVSALTPITSVKIEESIIRTEHSVPTGAQLINQYPMEVSYLSKSRYIVESQFFVAGRRLLITINKRHDYGIYPTFLGTTALLMFLVVSLIIVTQARVRNRAEKLAVKIAEQLHVSEDRLKAATDGSNDGIWDWDIVNDTVWFSRRYYEILGYEDTAFAPSYQAFKSRVHPEDVHIVSTSLKDHLEKGIQYAPTFRMQHKQGHYIWIHSRGQARIVDGKAIRMAGVHTDITREKSREFELFKAHQKAESAAEVKAQFLANMSHEIRTPLNGIVGIGELLSQTPLNSKQHQYVGTLRDSCQTLLQIVNDILDYSKLEAKKMPVEQIAFSLPDAIENCLALVLPETEKREKLELIYRYSPTLPHNFVSDPTRIRQIIINLLSNAVKFTDEGYVFVNVDGAPSLDKRGVYDISLTVQDTGIGMDKAVTQNLFDKFTQADDSTTRKYGGTGLGLSIIRELVKLLGGEVKLDSQLNKGTTFTVQLSMPLAEQEASQTAELPNIADSRVLIVEEQQIVINIIKEALERHGAYVDGCTSPSQAIQVMESQKTSGYPYTAVVMNHTMSPISGPKLALETRQNPALKDTHMLLITSQSRRGDGKKMRALGFEAYLAKPIVTEHVCFALNEILLAAKKSEQPTFITRHSYAEHKRNKVTEQGDTLTGSLFYTPTILVVEDNLTNQQIMAWLLDDIGTQYLIAENGEKAIKMLDENQNISLILMDCHMPVMDGLTATRAIRKRSDHFSEIPIIALSANNQPTDREECLNSGMNAFISKPIERNQLTSIISQYLPNIAPTQEASSNEQIQKTEPIADAEKSDSPALNTQKLLDLTSGARSLTERFLGMFDESVQGCIVGMEEALQAEDLKALQSHAHTLKGAAANLSAEALRDLADSIEQNAKAGSSENAVATITAIRDAYQQFQKEANGLLETLHDD